MSAYDAHKNFAYSTVATAPSPATSGTSLTVATGDGTKFPTPPFNCTAWPASTQPSTANAEEIRVTAVAGDVFTIVRAQESSTAQSIAVGYQIDNSVSVKVITDIETTIPQNIYDVTNYGAVGDNSTDDTTAINSAIAAMNTNKGGILYFPAKTNGYKVTTNLTPIGSSAGQGHYIVLGPGPVRPTNGAGGLLKDTSTNESTLWLGLSIVSSTNAAIGITGITAQGPNATIRDCYFSFINQPVFVNTSSVDGHTTIVGNKVNNASHSLNSNQGAFHVLTGAVRIEGNTLQNSTYTGTNDAFIYMVAATSNFWVINNSISSTSGTVNNGLYIEAGASNFYFVIGNDFHLATTQIGDNGTGTSKQVALNL